MDISAFRQMVEKNPRGFLGRYGLGNKILQEGGRHGRPEDRSQAGNLSS